MHHSNSEDKHASSPYSRLVEKPCLSPLSLILIITRFIVNEHRLSGISLFKVMLSKTRHEKSTYCLASAQLVDKLQLRQSVLIEELSGARFGDELSRPRMPPIRFFWRSEVGIFPRAPSLF